MSSLKARLNDDVKQALRAGDKPRVGTLRMTLAAIKQREVDERIELDDPQVIAVIEKMVKQRRESIKAYRDGGRDDLAANEEAEVEMLTVYLPEPLDQAAVATLVDETIAACGATGMQDMGRVMAALKEKAAGRADMSGVSKLVRARLAG